SNSPPASVIAEIKHLLIFSLIICCLNIFDALQLSLGFTSFNTSSDIFTTFSKDTSQLLNLSSTLRARIGVGPATPNDRRKSTIFFLSSDNFTYATVPIVAISIAFLIAYFIYLP